MALQAGVVVAYTLSVPDHFFEAKGGLDRQLIRQAMAGLLPDEVRLQQSATEVEAALAEVASGLARNTINWAPVCQAGLNNHNFPS